MEVVSGSANFSMDNFSPENFASMNVAEMGMSPAMMAGALDSLPVGSAAAALETLQENPGGLASGFGAMSGTMTGTIAASMADKGMGTEMMGAMGASMGVNGLADAANGMSGLAGMEAMGEAMASMGMETMNATLQTAFSSPSTGITDAMSGTVGIERIFPFNLPTINKIEVNKRGKVRRSRIYCWNPDIGYRNPINSSWESGWLSNGRRILERSNCKTFLVDFGCRSMYEGVTPS